MVLQSHVVLQITGKFIALHSMLALRKKVKRYLHYPHNQSLDISNVVKCDGIHRILKYQFPYLYQFTLKLKN